MFKIEAGKYYKTRNGLKARVLQEVPNLCDAIYPFIGGVLGSDGYWHVHTWTDAGINIERDNEELNSHDLIALWQDEQAELREIEALVSSESEYQSLTSHGKRATDKMQELITAVNQLIRERKGNE